MREVNTGPLARITEKSFSGLRPAFDEFTGWLKREAERV